MTLESLYHSATGEHARADVVIIGNDLTICAVRWNK